MLNLNKRSDELDMWYSAKSSEVRLSVLCCNVGCMQKKCAFERLFGVLWLEFNTN